MDKEELFEDLFKETKKLVKKNSKSTKGYGLYYKNWFNIFSYKLYFCVDEDFKRYEDCEKRYRSYVCDKDLKLDELNEEKVRYVLREYFDKFVE
nr:hypothetical protein [uncultured Pseudogulbenkiania sp.]